MELRQRFEVGSDIEEAQKINKITSNTNGFFDFEKFTPRFSIKRLVKLSKKFPNSILGYSYSKDGEVETFYEIKKGKVINSGERLVSVDEHSR